MVTEDNKNATQRSIKNNDAIEQYILKDTNEKKDRVPKYIHRIV